MKRKDCKNEYEKQVRTTIFIERWKFKFLTKKENAGKVRLKPADGEIQMKYKKRNVRWMLVVYDLLVYELSAVLLLGLYGGNDKLSISGMMQQMVLALLCVFSIRLIWNGYGQIWRYGGIQCYIRLLYTDAIAFFVYLILELILPVEKITFARMLCLSSINLLGALALRMMYRYAYKCSNKETNQGRFLASLLYIYIYIYSAE